jgi:hypothetical protein
VQPASVLGDGSSPRDWKRQKQGVQARIVESLSDVLAGCQDGPRLIARDGCEPSGDGLPLLLAHPRSQDHEVTHVPDEPALEAVEDAQKMPIPAIVGNSEQWHSTAESPG